jgi:hypothetical protein
VVYEREDGGLDLADGTALPDSVAQRLGCDCREQHADGSLTDAIPEVTADPPPPLRADVRSHLDAWLPFTDSDPPPADWDDSS